MLNKTTLILAVGALVTFSSIASVSAASMSLGSKQIVARRGADDKPGDVRGEGAGHPVTQSNDIVARRGAGDIRGEGAGHPVIQGNDIVARRGAGEPGDVRGEGAGHPVIQGNDNVARRGADDPKGHVRQEDRRQDRREDRRQS